MQQKATPQRWKNEAAATGQTWLGTSRFFIAAALPFAARRGTVRRREWLGSAANGRMAAVAAMAVQSSWLRINAATTKLILTVL